jgi:hypothetical protein
MSFTYNVFACSIMAVSMGTLVHPLKRTWGLTAIIAPIFTIFGLAETLFWLSTGDLHSGPDTVALLELMKAYLLVDLCYAAVVDFWTVPLLTGWIHHVAYFYVVDHMLTTQQDGMIRPFLLAELPTAILAWGHIVPALRSDRLFGATFLLTRIILPIIFTTQFYATDFIWSVIFIALSVHVYWFGRWVAAQQRRNAVID